ncbi:hypothetical protein [Haloarcula japonica]|uniref:Uncharacterized protein n=1 Tax=Haloarcula japonica (strain ATCC 49778 / DSM 6131 / JCM 7785 / NBRC 101032 / NCIMB 13157 / TR-1) TaxID=1227453 RepID=M0LCY1_HALJT|nr:hypothetical protein [Haloarcula japonica]EMA30968.1 hypothetical protein C444_08615 [Haloarcula japonica DSM 6131]
MSAQWPEKDLADVHGADEYIVVKAWVNHIEDVASHRPHQKGILGDESTWDEDARKFTVWDPDLDLEKGNLYRIFGKERTYEPLGEIQIQISDADHVDLLCEGE